MKPGSIAAMALAAAISTGTLADDAATVAARSHFFGVDNVDQTTGALDKEKVRASLRRTATRNPAELTSFPVPTLLVAGGQDVVFPPFLASDIAASLPRGECELLPQAGHSPYFEDAATFNRLVEAFLARQR